MIVREKERAREWRKRCRKQNHRAIERYYTGEGEYVMSNRKKEKVRKKRMCVYERERKREKERERERDRETQRLRQDSRRKAGEMSITSCKKTKTQR